MLEGAWGTLAIVGVIVLGAAIAFAMFKNSQNDSPEELAVSERGTENLYAAESAREVEEERREEAAGRQPGGPDPRLSEPGAERDVRLD